MNSHDKATAEEAPAKSKKKLIVIVLTAVLLLGGTAGGCCRAGALDVPRATVGMVS